MAIAADIGEQPKLIKALGEELVLFRDKSGQIGLVHKHCPHRRASLEYGHCEQHGIRCCYHGWLFDIDGTILEIPSEPPGLKLVERVQQTVRLGAYPTHEFRGLVFAYLGPPQAQPAFPHYDAYDTADITMSPYQAPFNCNWLQVLDAIVDPAHTAFYTTINSPMDLACSAKWSFTSAMGSATLVQPRAVSVIMYGCASTN